MEKIRRLPDGSIVPYHYWLIEWSDPANGSPRYAEWSTQGDDVKEAAVGFAEASQLGRVVLKLREISYPAGGPELVHVRPAYKAL